MDFEDLDKKAADAKLLMLCSPHNPVGRVWTKDELKTLGEICRKHNLYVLSDEIHFDLDYDHRHTVFTLAAPELADRSIICTAPSKTFNLAGNALSNIFIPNQEIREKFQADQNLHCGHFLGTFAYASTTAAYEGGGEWLDALLVHLRHNRQVLKDRLTALIPGAVLYPLEGTYLQWIDLSCLGLSAGAADEEAQRREGVCQRRRDLRHRRRGTYPLQSGLPHQRHRRSHGSSGKINEILSPMLMCTPNTGRPVLRGMQYGNA